MLDKITFPNLGFSLNPSSTAFSVGGFEIKWYGVIIALGFLLAVLYAMKRSREFGLTQDNILDLLLIVAPVAIICARAYYVVFSWKDYFGPEATQKFWDIRSGGLAIYGAVIGAALMILVMARIKKQKVTPYLDITGLGLLIGQSLGRWGNFFNREAFGGHTENLFAMQLSLNDAADKITDSTALEKLNSFAAKGGYEGFVRVHPTFFYESVWNLAGFVLIHFLSKKRKFDGQVFLMYLLWYGLGRAWIEGLRTDSLMMGPLRASQWIALACVVIAGGLLIFFRIRPIPAEKMYVNCVKAEEEDLLELMNQPEKSEEE